MPSVDQARKAERLLKLNPAAWRHAQVVGKLSLGHAGLGELVIGLAAHRMGGGGLLR